MKTTTIFLLLLFCSISFGQKSGELRFNYDKLRAEIFIDAHYETFGDFYADSSSLTGGYFRIIKHKIKGWYGIDSLYLEHGDYFNYGWDTYDLGYYVGMRKLFNVLIAEKFMSYGEDGK